MSYHIHISPTNRENLRDEAKEGGGSGPKRFSTGNSYWKNSPNVSIQKKNQCHNELSKHDSKIIFERLTNVQENMMCSNVDAVCGKEILAEYSFCAIKGAFDKHEKLYLINFCQSDAANALHLSHTIFKFQKYS